MINMSYFHETEKRIQTASAAELVEIRKKALSESQYEEAALLACRPGEKITWQEDRGFIYLKNMQFVAACSLRLAQLYAEAEDEEG